MPLADDARAAGSSTVSSLRVALAERMARVMRRDPELVDTAVEVGIVDRKWLEEPGRHPLSTTTTLDMVQRFLERSVERKPSALAAIGLNAIQASFLAGATTIIAVDMVSAKEKMAREFGATHFIDASVTSDTVKAIQEIVPGGVTFSFEAVGHPAVMRNAIDCVGWGGSCVMLGVPPLGTEVSFVAAGLYNDKAILGCRYGTSRPRADIPMLADLYLAGRLKLDELVTRTYPLDEIQTVFDDVTAGSLARGVLTF